VAKPGGSAFPEPIRSGLLEVEPLSHDLRHLVSLSGTLRKAAGHDSLASGPGLIGRPVFLNADESCRPATVTGQKIPGGLLCPVGGGG
jgi:hypothetical protein